MRETKEKQIGTRGFRYHVIQFGAREGGRVLVRLLKMIGGAAGEAMAGGDDALDGFDLSTVGKMIGNLAETLNESDFDYLVDKFSAVTAVSGGEYTAPLQLNTEGVFDLHFAGEYQELGQWLLFCVEVNFGGFLEEGGIVQRAKAAASDRQASSANEDAPSKSISPNISAASGGSGA